MSDVPSPANSLVETIFPPNLEERIPMHAQTIKQYREEMRAKFIDTLGSDWCRLSHGHEFIIASLITFEFGDKLKTLCGEDALSYVLEKS